MTVSDSRHCGERFFGPSKSRPPGEKNLQYFSGALPNFAAMGIEFALDWEKLLTPWRTEGQNCLGAGTQGGLQLF